MYNTIKVFSPKEKFFFAILAILILPISGLGVDIYAPSLPSVAHYFGVEKSLVQLSITSYMVGLGVMQLFAGSISDSFGRKVPFLISAFIFLIATLVIPWAQTIDQLIILRFVQGISVATMSVPMRSVIADLFEGRELYHWMNYAVMAWSIGPIVAPAIGGYLQHFLGWKSNFYFLALYILLTGLMVCFYFSETSQHRHPFHIVHIAKRYKEIIFNLEYINVVLMNGLLYSFIILFTIVGPFLVQTDMHYSAIEFGQMALLMGLAWFIGTFTNRFTIHIPFVTKAKICLLSMFVIVACMLSVALYYKMNIYILLVPVALMSWLGGIIFPNNFARAVALFPTMTGSANALMGGFIFIITGLSSGLATYLKSSTLVPLSVAYLGIIALCLLLVFLRRRVV